MPPLAALVNVNNTKKSPTLKHNGKASYLKTIAQKTQQDTKTQGSDARTRWGTYYRSPKPWGKQRNARRHQRPRQLTRRQINYPLQAIWHHARRETTKEKRHEGESLKYRIDTNISLPKPKNHHPKTINLETHKPNVPQKLHKTTKLKDPLTPRRSATERPKSTYVECNDMPTSHIRNRLITFAYRT